MKAISWIVVTLITKVPAGYGSTCHFSQLTENIVMCNCSVEKNDIRLNSTNLSLIPMRNPPLPLILDLLKTLKMWKLGPNLICISWQTSRIVDLLERFSRHTSAHIRALCSWEKAFVTEVVDAGLPFLTSLVCRIDVFQALSLNLLDCVNNPAALDFNTSRSVGKQCWSVRAVKMKHVRVARDCGSQIRERCFLPLRFESHAINVLQPHRGHTTSGDVEAGGDNDHVKLVHSAILKFDTLGSEADNRISPDINKINIRAIELLVVVELETWAFDAKWVGRLQGGKQIAKFGIPNAVANVPGPEIIR